MNASTVDPKALAVALATAALLAIAPATAEAGGAQADARLDRALKQLVRLPDGPPGAAVMVQRGDRRRLHTAGGALLGSPRRIRAHQRTRIASVSKAFSGAVALRLVERGRLKLGSRIGAVLPELPAAWHPITLRELLYHTSGLPNYNADPGFLAYFSTHLKDYISPLQAISYVFDDPLEFAPSQRYEYSNTDNIVIGLMAERATGRPYGRVLSDLVFRPLRMRDSSLPSDFVLPRPFVRGYVFDGPGLPLENVSEQISASGVWAAGGIVSSARDLNTFIRAWGGGGLLRTKAMRRAQTRFIRGAAGEPPGPGYNSGGLTLFRYKLPCGTVFGHTGNFPGYTQFIASSPDGERSATVSVNIQLAPDTGPTGMSSELRRVFRRAACAALAG